MSFSTLVQLTIELSLSYAAVPKSENLKYFHNALYKLVVIVDIMSTIMHACTALTV